MTSTDEDMKELIDDLWRPIGPDDEDRIELQKLVELGRQQAVEVFSKSPLHRERAKKNPEYWKTMGLMEMWPKEGA